MKIPKFIKKNNPHNVQVGQVWKAKDKRRKGKFTVTGIDHVSSLWVAIVVYKGKSTYRRTINLKRFDRYVKCK